MARLDVICRWANRFQPWQRQDSLTAHLLRPPGLEFQAAMVNSTDSPAARFLTHPRLWRGEAATPDGPVARPRVVGAARTYRAAPAIGQNSLAEKPN